jgi:hypothetical protein
MIGINQGLLPIFPCPSASHSPQSPWPAGGSWQIRTAPLGVTAMVNSCLSTHSHHSSLWNDEFLHLLCSSVIRFGLILDTKHCSMSESLSLMGWGVPDHRLVPSAPPVNSGPRWYLQLAPSLGFFLIGIFYHTRTSVLAMYSTCWQEVFRLSSKRPSATYRGHLATLSPPSHI